MVRITRIGDFQISNKIAAFDYDHTLIKPKEGKTFASNIDDWSWYLSNIPDKLRSLNKQNYSIVIFSNQSKEWKCDQISNVLSSLNIPILIVIANLKEDYKPNRKIFDLAFPNIIPTEDSFFVGDALGRKDDHSDSDLLFARNIGLKCYAPEEYFRISKPKLIIPSKVPKAKKCPEMIVMVGPPGSGKSTITEYILKPRGYDIYSGDIYKTTDKMIKSSKLSILNMKSMVFDATNRTIKKRLEYINYAKNMNYPIRCIYMSISIEKAMENNSRRTKPVPRIVYSMYSKELEIPTEEEFPDGLIII